MYKIPIGGHVLYPEFGTGELEKMPLTDRHQLWLRGLIIAGLTPIYIGDDVKIVRPMCPDCPEEHIGKSGKVIEMGIGIAGAFNAEFASYLILTPGNEVLNAYHYMLDRKSQPPGNAMLEKILTNTNEPYKKCLLEDASLAVKI